MSSSSVAEALVFTGQPFIVNAQALTDSRVLSIGKLAVIDEIGRDSRFALGMLAGISGRRHGLVRIDKRDVHILDPKRQATYQVP